MEIKDKQIIPSCRQHFLFIRANVNNKCVPVMSRGILVCPTVFFSLFLFYSVFPHFNAFGLVLLGRLFPVLSS